MVADGVGVAPSPVVVGPGDGPVGSGDALVGWSLGVGDTSAVTDTDTDGDGDGEGLSTDPPGRCELRGAEPVVATVDGGAVPPPTGSAVVTGDGALNDGVGSASPRMINAVASPASATSPAATAPTSGPRRASRYGLTTGASVNVVGSAARRVAEPTAGGGAVGIGRAHV